MASRSSAYGSRFSRRTARIFYRGTSPSDTWPLSPSTQHAFFSRNDRNPADPNDFHRLDLVLAPSATVRWRIDLPPSVKIARFLTRVRAAPGDGMLARGARVNLIGEAGEARVFVPARDRKDLSLDLRPYAGRTVTLQVLSEEAGSNVPLLFEAPRVDLTLDPGAESATAVSPGK